MRKARLSRATIGLASVTALALTATVLAQATSDTPAAVAQQPVAPSFLSWDGDAFNDGQNHFLITASKAQASHDGWLRLDVEDHLVTAFTATPQDTVGLGEIEDAVAGNANIGASDVLHALAERADISEVRALGFELYAVAGSIGAAELRALPGVSGVATDSALTAAAVDPYYPTQWGLDNDGSTSNTWQLTADADIDAPEAWHRTRGSGVVVAVIDSGIDVAHPDLTANIWRNPNEDCDNGVDDDGNGYVDDCTGWDFANNDASVDDLIGHGTHVAGIIAAEANNRIGVAGVAYEAEVMALKIGDGTPALSAAIEAISYAIDNGARVINASWMIEDPAAGPYLDVALAAAEEAGVLFVTGAGNEPIDLDTNPVFPASSVAANVVVVGASTATDQAATFSGFGASTVDLFAPGEHIISTVPGGYGVYSGTSMATPMVSGAAALLWAATPEATVAEVKGALLDRSDGPNDGVAAFRNQAVSQGRLNVGRAIYTRLFQPSVMFDFHEFNSFRPDRPHKVAVIAKTVDPWMVPPQTPAMYRAGLYVPSDGKPMAVVGLDITYAEAGEDRTVTTDITGRVLVGNEFEPQQRPSLVQNGDLTPLGMELPAGTYAFVMEIVDVSAPETPVPMGDPSAVFFIVDDDGSVSEMPNPPPISVPPTTPPGDAEPIVTSTTAGQSTTTTSLTVTTITTPTSQPDVTTTVGVTPTTPQNSTTTLAPGTTTTVGPAVTTTTSPGTVTTTSPPEPNDGDDDNQTVDPCTDPIADDGDGGDSCDEGGSNDPAEDDDSVGMAIARINPASGPVAGGSLVTITGSKLPENPEVLFGDRRAELISVVAPNFIVVNTPAGNPGWVDVTVVDRDTGARAVFARGFAYVSDDEAPPQTTTTTRPPSATTTTAPVSTIPSTSTPTTQATTTVAPSSTTLATSTTIPLPVAEQVSIDDWVDSLLRTPQGLTLAPPAPDAAIGRLAVSLWVGELCDEPVCPGWVLEN